MFSKKDRHRSCAVQLWGEVGPQGQDTWLSDNHYRCLVFSRTLALELADGFLQQVHNCLRVSLAAEACRNTGQVETPLGANNFQPMMYEIGG